MDRPTENHLRRTQVLRQLVAARTPTDDLAHDLDHVERVCRWAVRLACEVGVDEELAEAAALVHDLVWIPKESSVRASASAQSARAARSVLAQAGFDGSEIERIGEAVRTSSWSAKVTATTDLGRVLQDADRLDAMGAIGVARSFATAQAMASRGASLRLVEPGDPLARHGRAPDDRAFAVDHFLVKLLRLRDGMHFRSSRSEAERRHQTMLALLDALQAELDGLLRPDDVQEIDSSRQVSNRRGE